MNPHFFGAILNSAVNSFAPYMKSQMDLLAMMSPRTNEGSESSPHLVAASSPAMTAEEELAYSMDIALGAHVAPPYLSGSAPEVRPLVRYARAGGIVS